MVVSDPVAARSRVCSVQFYVAIAVEMVAAILKNQSLVYQKLMEIITLMQKEATMTNSDALVLTNETIDFQMTDEDLAVEDHFDECDFNQDWLL